MLGGRDSLFDSSSDDDNNDDVKIPTTRPKRRRNITIRTENKELPEGVVGTKHNYAMGTTLKKKFNGKVFRGEVASLIFKMGVPLYTVFYEDGDAEEMLEAELVQLIGDH